MAPSPQYTIEDRLGVIQLVSRIVGHEVVFPPQIGGKKDGPQYQIQPRDRQAVMAFWYHSDYGKTQQYWPSPIEAGIHYAKHYLAFTDRDFTDLTAKPDSLPTSIASEATRIDYRAFGESIRLRPGDVKPAPNYGPVEVGVIVGNKQTLQVSVTGIDGYSNSEIRTIIEAAFERSVALKLLAENE